MENKDNPQNKVQLGIGPEQKSLQLSAKYLAVICLLRSRDSELFKLASYTHLRSPPMPVTYSNLEISSTRRKRLGETILNTGASTYSDRTVLVNSRQSCF